MSGFRDMPDPWPFTGGEPMLFRFDGFLGDDYCVCRYEDLTPTNIESVTGYVPLADVLLALEK